MTSTDTPPPPPTMPLGMAQVVTAVATALLLAGAVMAGVLAALGDASAWRGFQAGTVVSIAAALASILPLRIGSRFGMMGLVSGFFAAGFVRAGISLGGCLAAVWLRDYPAAPTLISMCGYYIAVLAAESIVVGRTLWNRPDDPKQ